MVKKGLLVLVLAGFIAGGAFALPEFKLAAGAGGYFTSDFGGGVESSGNGMTWTLNTPYAGGGGFAFFDATYAELSFGFFGGGGTTKTEMSGGGNSVSSESDWTVAGLDIALMGKYPFAITEKLSLYPLLGITGRIMVSAQDEDGDPLENSDGDEIAVDLSALWFNLGGGVDFFITEKIFLRGGLTYGIRVPNKYENDMVDDMDGGDPKTLLGHGLTFKIAVGYQF